MLPLYLPPKELPLKSGGEETESKASHRGPAPRYARGQNHLFCKGSARGKGQCRLASFLAKGFTRFKMAAPGKTKGRHARKEVSQRAIPLTLRAGIKANA